jgi:hypothetical protein
MGFFSYTCAKTHLPIMASTSWEGPPEMCQVVVLKKDGSSFQGSYDGYGRVSGVEVDYEDLESGQVKYVLQKFWNGETFDQLGNSHNDPGQGHFHNAAKVMRWYAQGGFPSYKDFIKAYNRS